MPNSLSYSLALGLALTALAVPGSSVAAGDLCEAIALVPVAAYGEPDQVLHPGQIDHEVSEYIVDKGAQDGIFCSPKDYCYPQYVTRNGARVETLRLLHCRIGAAWPVSKGDTDVTYRLTRTR